MKTKKIALLLTSIAVIALMVTPVFANGNGDYVSNLYATSELIDVGEVVVSPSLDPDILYVTYMVDGGCYLLETHLMVVDNADDFPMTKTGNPKVGLFTYSTDPHDPMTTMVQYTVDISGLGSPLFIAAHAVVSWGCEEETAWGDRGCPANMFEFDGSNWFFYFQYPPP